MFETGEKVRVITGEWYGCVGVVCDVDEDAGIDGGYWVKFRDLLHYIEEFAAFELARVDSDEYEIS